MTPESRTPSGDSSGEGALDAQLLALRVRLRQAREERGSCPPWDELRADVLPGGGSRPGREERIAHSAICPYCDAHMREWRNSLDHTSDALEAVERGVLRGITGGARRLFGTIGRARRGRSEHAAAKREEAPPPAPPPAPQRALSAREERELEQRNAEQEATRSVARYEPPAELRSEPRIEPKPARPAPPAPRGDPGSSGILVVEITADRMPPEAVFLCAQVLGLEVAIVDAFGELAGDPDLGAVRGVILAAPRAPETWPDAVRQARALIAGCPVVLMAPFGVTPSAGAKRALGEALLAEDAPAERLLILLDPNLR